jgi:hypothetical protein
MRAVKAREAGSNATIPIDFIVLTSLTTWESRGLQVARTWGLWVQPPHRLFFSTDVPIYSFEDGLNAAFWTADSNKTRGRQTSKNPAQRRFVQSLLGVPVRPEAWVLLCDDDAFVYPARVDALAAAHDPAKVALFGQIECPPPQHKKEFPSGSFCGGAGALYSPSLMQGLRGLGDLPEYDARSTTYEFRLVPVITGRLGGTLIHHREFHSQPPAFYRFAAANGDREDHGGDAPITWHYVDAWHQSLAKRYNDHCRPSCPALYQQLFEC